MNLNFSEINREFPIQLRSTFGLLVSWSAHICQALFGKRIASSPRWQTNSYISHPPIIMEVDNGSLEIGIHLKWSCSTSVVGKKVSLKYKILEHVRICLIFHNCWVDTPHMTKLSIRLPTSTKLEQVHLYMTFPNAFWESVTPSHYPPTIHTPCNDFDVAQVILHAIFHKVLAKKYLCVVFGPILRSHLLQKYLWKDPNSKNRLNRTGWTTSEVA